MDNVPRISLPEWLSPRKPLKRRSLLDLPPEVRLMIYAEVIKTEAGLRKGLIVRCKDLCDTTNHTECTNSALYYPGYASLWRLNHQIREEVIDAQSLSLPANIRVDIFNADYRPLRQFTRGQHRWKKYIENETTITAVLHYDPKDNDEAAAWGVNFICSSFHDSFKINYQIADCEPTFWVDVRQHCKAIKEMYRLYSWVQDLAEGRDSRTLPFSWRLNVNLITAAALQQTWCWERFTSHEDAVEIAEMYMAVEDALKKSRRGFWSSIALQNCAFTLEMMATCAFMDLCSKGAARLQFISVGWEKYVGISRRVPRRLLTSYLLYLYCGRKY